MKWLRNKLLKDYIVFNKKEYNLNTNLKIKKWKKKRKAEDQL